MVLPEGQEKQGWGVETVLQCVQGTKGVRWMTLDAAEQALNLDCRRRSQPRELEALSAATRDLARGDAGARALARVLERVLADPAAAARIRRHVPGSLFEYGSQGQVLVESPEGRLFIRPFSDGTFAVFPEATMRSLAACGRAGARRGPCPRKGCLAVLVDARREHPALEPRRVVCRGLFDCRLGSGPSGDALRWSRLKESVTSLLEHGSVSVSDLGSRHPAGKPA